VNRPPAAACAVVLLLVIAAATARADGLDGNALLRRSARLNQPPEAYAVPLHFEVHLERPVGFRFHADAVAYFEAPDKQALVITSMPRPLRRMFGRSYSGLDTVEANWPAHYHVFSVVRTVAGGVPLYHLDALPQNPGGVTHVTFDLLGDGLVPVRVTWFFRDGSTIRLFVTNERVGPYVLPSSEDIAVTMPRFALDANGVAGGYALDPPIPAGVFAAP
jgi:hypothetical protein